MKYRERATSEQMWQPKKKTKRLITLRSKSTNKFF